MIYFLIAITDYWIRILFLLAQDSSIRLCRLDSLSRENKDPVIQSIRLRDLPMCSLLFLSESALVAAGHDFNPALFVQKDSGKILSFYVSM